MQNAVGANFDRIPSGWSQMQFFKPPEVNISVTVNSGSSSAVGPIDEPGYFSLPSTTTSLDISLDIPPFPWYDNNNAALTVSPGPFPPSPPTPPISPPLPPAPPIDPTASTKVTATFTVALDIRNGSKLETVLARRAANIEAGIDGFTNNQILGLVDFSKVLRGL